LFDRSFPAFLPAALNKDWQNGIATCTKFALPRLFAFACRHEVALFLWQRYIEIARFHRVLFLQVNSGEGGSADSLALSFFDPRSEKTTFAKAEVDDPTGNLDGLVRSLATKLLAGQGAPENRELIRFPPSFVDANVNRLDGGSEQPFPPVAIP